jgi:hypothetical protein
VTPPCDLHQWTHATEPCPYCREIHREPVHRAITNADRAERLTRAITAAVVGEASEVEDLFTPDVVGSGPALGVASREELAVEIEEREGVLHDVEIAFAPLEVANPKACVEWVASGVRVGPLTLDDSLSGVLAPPGRRVRVRGVTVAEFEGARISSFRSYWDDLPQLQDLGGSK